ncbi:ComEA family DNA-binding protein [Paenibacillus lemnae]|uniref:Helix-hairpin-helix domain-containing protein n=1 Tax=Paenibacillus lemnae TaxID=1330551 RepID=A0A848M1P9_PAELE|nr:helix-hairpin-helix domain-containing protein [Paenibacillus lemnae]NMO94868.1 helix-hairpin-helix domain-containing protein [Paenibacillus lemnae]
MRRTKMAASIAVTLLGCGLILFSGGEKSLQDWVPLNAEMEEVLGLQSEGGKPADEKEEAAAKVDKEKSKAGKEKPASAPLEEADARAGNAAPADKEGQHSASSTEIPDAVPAAQKPVSENSVPSSPAAAAEKARGSAASSAQDGTININTANLSMLMELPGIGEKKAQAILDYRNTHGSFQKPADLMEVKGIGPKMFEKMKTYIAL